MMLSNTTPDRLRHDVDVHVVDLCCCLLCRVFAVMFLRWVPVFVLVCVCVREREREREREKERERQHTRSDKGIRDTGRK